MNNYKYCITMESDDEKEIMQRNWRRNLSDIEKASFRDGAVSSNTETDEQFQIGFEEGFMKGYSSGYEQGSYKNTIRLLSHFNMTDDTESTSSK